MNSLISSFQMNVFEIIDPIDCSRLISSIERHRLVKRHQNNDTIESRLVTVIS